MEQMLGRLRAFCAPLLNASAYDRTRWLILVIVFSACCFAAEYFLYLNFRLGIDTQTYRCLDEWVYVIDIRSRRPELNKTFAIEARGAEPVIRDGTLMAKIIRGMPGDTVTINDREEIFVNGHLIGKGLDHLHGLNPKQMSKFFGSRKLAADEYWVMGTRFRSFDSRYYGPVKLSQIKGRAYALF